MLACFECDSVTHSSCISWLFAWVIMKDDITCLICTRLRLSSKNASHAGAWFMQRKCFFYSSALNVHFPLVYLILSLCLGGCATWKNFSFQIFWHSRRFPSVGVNLSSPIRQNVSFCNSGSTIEYLRGIRCQVPFWELKWGNWMVESEKVVTAI